MISHVNTRLASSGHMERGQNFMTQVVSLEGKCKTHTPTEIRDIAGIRIAGYLLQDVIALCTLVERYFRIVDKSDKLEYKVGYRGTNYVAIIIEETMSRNPEYKKFKQMYFEIQVKTILDCCYSRN